MTVYSVPLFLRSRVDRLHPLFRTTILFGLLVELLSLLGKDLPLFQIVAWASVCLVTLILTWQHLEYGLWIVLAELITGSKSGHLFSVALPWLSVSLRMGIFAVVMGVWAIRCVQGKYWGKLKESKKLWVYWGILLTAVAWAIFRGVAHGNSLRDVFFDANAFLYVLLLLPVLCADGKKLWEGGRHVAKGALILLASKTIAIIYLFSHANSPFIEANLRPLYRWIRDSGVGEITVMESGFARVFFQSHIYFLLLLLVLLFKPFSDEKKFYEDRHFWILAVLGMLVIGSFSRSFWIAAVLLLGGYGVKLMIKRQWGKATVFARRAILVFVTGFILLLGVVRFPLPLPTSINLNKLLEDRLLELDEAAARSRWQLVGPLWGAIKHHPVLGSGFGTRVTYISNDPRVRSFNPSGKFTTFSFEWGYGDLWLKMGIPGLLAYGGLLVFLWRRTPRAYHPALAALLLVHFFTPYLNHPLGLGLLLALSAQNSFKEIDITS